MIDRDIPQPDRSADLLKAAATVRRVLGSQWDDGARDEMLERLAQDPQVIFADEVRTAREAVYDYYVEGEERRMPHDPELARRRAIAAARADLASLSKPDPRIWEHYLDRD